MSHIRWLLSGVHLLIDITRRLPGGGYTIEQALRVEQSILRAVTPRVEGPDQVHDDNLAVADPEKRNPTPGEVLSSLLDRSMYATPDDTRLLLHHALLCDLLPDEARILAALSDGSAYPVVHVGEPGAELILRNASTVGRQAGVSLPHHTPVYVSRIVNLGLAQLGPESSAMRDDYDMLMTEPAVNDALSTTGSRLRPARVVRRTLRITDLGREVWEAAT